MGLGIVLAVDGTIDTELTQATSVEVFERMGGTTSYSIHFGADICEGDLPLLFDKRLDPGSMISILAPVDNTTHCLVKGSVHSHQMHMEHGGAGTTVVVKGSDTTVVMDRETKSAVWTDLTDSDAVRSILGNYGLLLDVQDTQAGHFEAKHTLVQRESDLRFVRRLARRNGFLFWITCDSKGVETAHFKHPPMDGDGEPKLVINMAKPNISSIDIQWDVERPTKIEGLQLDLNTKKNMEILVDKTPLTILGKQGLGKITKDKRSVHLSAPADDAGNMKARGEGALIEADWFIRATCQTSLESLGDLVHANKVIELRGAGSRHSGKYFVAGVHHTIDAEQHRMDVELIRNGWGG